MTLPNKRRSRRLRKKLHVGEFQELGFGFEVEFKTPATSELQELMIDCFLSEVIEPRLLAFGGWIGGGFITCDGRGSVLEDDREAIQNWLAARPEIGEVRVGPLKDAWHAPEYAIAT